jgi:hypothetical protein
VCPCARSLALSLTGRRRWQQDENAQFESSFVDTTAVIFNSISAFIVLKFVFDKLRTGKVNPVKALFNGGLQLVRFVSGGVVLSLSHGLAPQAAAFMLSTVFLMHTHFMQDITYMTGAVLHHARDDALG